MSNNQSGPSLGAPGNSARSVLQKYGLPALAASLRFLCRGSNSLTSSDMDITVWLRAIVFTAILSAVANTWLMHSVDRNYYHARLAAINEAQSTDEAVDAAIALCGADASAAQQDVVREAFRQRTPTTTCRDYLLSLIREMQGNVSPALESALDRQMTGQRSGFRFYVVSSQSVSGQKAIEALRNADQSWQHKRSVQEEAGSKKGGEAEAFLAKFVDRVAQETRPSQRNLMRYNGWIQWWTICVCIVVLLLAFSRAALLARLVQDGWFSHGTTTPSIRFLAACDSTNSARPTTTAAAFVAAHPMAPLLDRQVYPTYEFLIGLLPSLGFIGTVLGMGDALLSADSLFSAVDKNQAISSITSHLGFAFDTTLVGLVTGILAGFAMLRLRMWETALWQTVSVDLQPGRILPHVPHDPARAI